MTIIRKGASFASKLAPFVAKIGKVDSDGGAVEGEDGAVTESNLVFSLAASCHEGTLWLAGAAAKYHLEMA